MHHSFFKNNKSDGKYMVYEIWEDEHPDHVVAGQKLENPSEESFSEERLSTLIPFWRDIAADKKLKKAIITIQADIGMGCELMYGYEDGRDEIPPNAVFYTVKPIFDKNISLLKQLDAKGKSLVYQSPLNSEKLGEELINFNRLLKRFFNGDYNKIFLEYSDKERDIFGKHQSELVIDNKKLRNA